MEIERDAFRPALDLSIDLWAEQNVVLPRSVAAEPGPMSLDRTPYLRGILRAATDPDVEEITLCFSTQVGKTTAGILMALYYLATDPFPALQVMPREDDAITINKDRYQRIIQASPALKALLTGAASDMVHDTIRLNGATFSFAGANSPAALSSRAVRLLLLGETDKYPPHAGKEASPIDLARERTRTFSNRLIVKDSTPTTEHGYIWNEFLAGDRQRYFVPCPCCGHYQRFVLGSQEPGTGGLKWPKEDLERIQGFRLAWYECAQCHGRIDDNDKPKMLRAGIWCPEVYEVTAEGKVKGPDLPKRHRSYHLWALYSPWLTFGAVAAEFLRSKDYPEKLMNFRNSWLAEVWEDRVEEMREAHVRARVADYRQGVVQKEAYVLLAGVDVQLDHLWYVIRAFGAHGESWLVRAGRVEHWDQLDTVLWRGSYLTTDEKAALGIKWALIDSGFRTDEVYRYCATRSAQAVKGSASVLRPWTSTAKAIKGSGTTIRLVTADTDYYKTKLHRLMRQSNNEPGSWHLPADLPEDYFKHMVAEQRLRVQDRKTGQSYLRWKVVHDGAANHLFDCEVLCVLAADILDVEYRWRTPPERSLESQSVEGVIKGTLSPVLTAKPIPKRRLYRQTTRVFS